MPPNRIQSRENARLKLARKVREGGPSEHMFVEGVRLAEETLSSPVAVEFCLIRIGFGDSPRERALLQALGERDVDIFELPTPVFSSISETRSSQGIVLICRQPAHDRTSFEKAVKSRIAAFPTVIMLTNVNNPSNLGAVIRSVEAAGASGAIISRGSANVFSSRSLRSSMGSAFRLPIWSGVDEQDVIEWSHDQGYLLTASAVEALVPYTELDWAKPRVLILGSEAHGIHGDLLAVADETIYIPMGSDVESLNLAVAAGVVLFEARRQVLAGR
jgi:TrmH family RNA methyltransferase